VVKCRTVFQWEMIWNRHFLSIKGEISLLLFDVQGSLCWSKHKYAFQTMDIVYRIKLTSSGVVWEVVPCSRLEARKQNQWSHLPLWLLPYIAAIMLSCHTHEALCLHGLGTCTLTVFLVSPFLGLWIVPQFFKLLLMRHICFDLVIRFIKNKKYAFFYIF